MLKDLIPISSLKRDEIYTFIAGIYVASIWYLFLVSTSLINHELDNTLYQTSMVLVMWLMSASVLFIILSVMSLAMGYTLLIYCDNQKSNELKKILKITKQYISYYPVEFSKEQLVYNHIYGLCIASIMMTLYPFLKLMSNLSHYFIIVAVAFVLSLLFSYFYHMGWLRYYSYVILKRRQMLDIYDEKKYSEEISVVLAKDNIDQNKNYVVSIKNSELQNKIIVINHDISFDDQKTSDGLLRLKWSALIKLDKSIDRSYLSKHARIDCTLHDADKYLIHMSSVSFDDYVRINLEPASNDYIDCSESELILRVKQISEVTATQVGRISFTNCMIRYL